MMRLPNFLRKTLFIVGLGWAILGLLNLVITWSDVEQLANEEISQDTAQQSYFVVHIFVYFLPGLLLIGLGTLIEPAPKEPTQGNRLTRDELSELQERLNSLGYTPGGTDGVCDATTQAAITAYQRNQGLPVTGQPTNELLQSLRKQAGSSDQPSR